MKFTDTHIKGAYRLELDKKIDDRGFFTRIWDAKELKARGLSARFVQGSISQTNSKGTLRGMHYQRFPHAENKLIRVTKGAIYDVIVDLRKQSPTYKKWFGAKLSEANHAAFYIPEGVAHGFVTITENVEVSYLMTAFYREKFQDGVRYDDPVFGIVWPVKIEHVSRKDAAFPNFSEESI